MALTDEGMGTTMLMQPAYGAPYGNNGGFGFGGDFMSWILLILLLGGGFGGFGFGGGYGAMMGMGMMDGFGLYPWLNNSQNINDGFRDQMLNNNVTSIRDGIQGLSTQLCQCCGDMRYDMSNGFNGVNNSIFGAQTAISQQLNSNELASLNRSFAEQTANMQGFNGVQSGIADLRYTEATEACATRNASAQNTRDIIDSQTRGTQAILDKLCALELDGVKGQLAQAQRENVALQNAVNMATMQASQTAQTAQILQGQNAEVDALYNRLKNCPVNAVPVYGSQPIFTCPNNNGCGCGNNF
jgi:hypothetical protein